MILKTISGCRKFSKTYYLFLCRDDGGSADRLTYLPEIRGVSRRRCQHFIAIQLREIKIDIRLLKISNIRHQFWVSSCVVSYRCVVCRHFLSLHLTVRWNEGTAADQSVG
jgi:hypothetical protein